MVCVSRIHDFDIQILLSTVFDMALPGDPPGTVGWYWKAAVARVPLGGHAPRVPPIGVFS